MENNNHSFLFVPATEKMLSKIEKCAADSIIIDLEDAILENDKDSALNRLEIFLKGYSYKTDIFIRINPTRVKQETTILNRYAIKGYMLPKTEYSEYIDNFAESAGDKRIIALIETAVGVVNAREIIKNQHVYIVAFGAEDYTEQCGIKNDIEYLIYPKSKLVAYAKAYKKPVIDTISLNIRDEKKYIIEAQNSRDFGFDGKLAIHPMQVEVINKIFSDNINYYKFIISEYDKCNTGVLNLNGRVFEKPHIDAMRKKIEDTNNE